MNVDERDDISIGHDQFSDINDSGSSLSSEYSFKRHCQREDPHSYGNVGLGTCISKFDGHNCLSSIGKYAHFKIV